MMITDYIMIYKKYFSIATNLMYTPRSFFSHLFLQMFRFILSLYNAGRTVTIPCKISVQSPVICVNSVYSRPIWSVYIHVPLHYMANWNVQNGRRPPSWTWTNRK